jgi:hypothetical protein
MAMARQRYDVRTHDAKGARMSEADTPPAGSPEEAPKNEPMKVVLSGVEISEDTRSLNVAITDIDMPFLSMVGFMVKWAFATIPAIIIIYLLVTVVGAVFGGIFGGLMMGR